MEATTVAASPMPSRSKFLASSPPPSSPSTVSARTVAPPLVVRHHNSTSEERVQNKNHVVKILINPKQDQARNADVWDKRDSVVCDVAPCVRISVNSDSEMIENHSMAETFCYGSYNYGLKSSGQISPFSDTPDSGTCSDLDLAPPPLPRKKSDGISITLIESHKRAPSSSSGAEVDSDDNESNISCDSLNSGKTSPSEKSSYLPQMLLHDIRQRKKLSSSEPPIIIEKSYEERKLEEREQEKAVVKYTADMFYNFHINEHLNNVTPKVVVDDDETFAGYKDMLNDGAATIRSAKGTVRGVKNRVRAGIATFLQIHSTGKNYKEKEAGKVVVYTTTMGIVRDTYQACMKVKQILRTLLVKYEERDVFMSSEYQAEIQERMQCKDILVPQMFVDGQHIGDAEIIERLNESGELRRILKPFKSMDVCTTCKVCGGFRLLPCQICNGSKKSVHRNHFTTEFVALKCMNCDEVGLVRCNSCS
ncbi:hypothetical protein NQ315_007756 [Exocentrus adspersus]|uniref:Glutaredoxin domain-containing protein n=1 Tax=Exocentrus adspersus TaxID=1586481 RepID=A0AAV8WAA7_9CUCU|nr:hypothetical protein NQ315_007756 [Exocentrus adspersus]